jgi:hypothetical protein
MTESTKIRLSPLLGEHMVPMFVDFLLAIVATIVVGVFAANAAEILLTLFGVGITAHIVQMRWLIYVRFDDTAITIVRLWRTQRVEWPYVTGLIYDQDSASGSAYAYRLRLILAGTEPPVDRFAPDSELRLHAKGPVVMSVWKTDIDATTSAGRCAKLVFAELEEHGLLPPKRLLPLAFRLRKYTPEQVGFASAVGSNGLAAVTVNHGVLTDGTRHLVTTVLPEFARIHVADEDQTVHATTYVTYVFQNPDAQQRADAFQVAVEDVIPDDWTVTGTALPSGPGLTQSIDR